ncbi:MAG: site-2 protease family protein [Lawsonibacter sp.]|nr:site-2 protease family protein [Lawsonibacter sp.]
MVYIFVAVFIFGILIATHELGHFATAKWLGVKVNEFSVGMGPAIFKKQKGETLYSLRVFPIGGYCAMEGEDDDSADPRAFGRAAAWKKMIILCAGAAMNFLTGLLLCLILVTPYVNLIRPVIVSFADGFPLVGSDGLVAGDRILSIDGERVYAYDDVTLLFSRSNGKTMDLVVERDGKTVRLDDLPLYPREYTEDGKTQLRYGINFLIEPATASGKLREGWYMAVDFVRLVRLSLGDLISGAAGLRDMSGPVGIVGMMSDVGSSAKTVSGALYGLAYLAALIAVNLAVMNLLPLPALDGGRIFFLILNGGLYALFRKKIDPKYEGYVHMAGLAALMALMLVVTLSDVGKLFGR